MHAFQYNDLKNIDDIHEISDSDYQCLEAIKNVLLEHGKASKFGINLLHRHFDVADDECVVEYTDKENRRLVSVVEKKGETNAMETMWRFDTNEAGLCVRTCHRTCYTGGGTFHKTSHPAGVHQSGI